MSKHQSLNSSWNILQDLQTTALALLSAAIGAVKPLRIIPEQVNLDGELLTISGHQFNLEQYRHVFIIGAGKASAEMAAALENILGKRISDGLVITKYHHSIDCNYVKIREAGHPLVDEKSVSATLELLKLVDAAGPDDLVICLISGGCSALLELPSHGITLADLQQTAELLLSSGANIAAVNTVRQQLSQVKGGGLLQRISPATCLSLIISDVIGDPLEFIGSGPTVPRTRTAADALKIVQQFDLESRLPTSILAHLQREAKWTTSDQVRTSSAENIILLNNRSALFAAAKAAEAMGMAAEIVSVDLQGEAREVGKQLAGRLRKLLAEQTPSQKLQCLLFGGETTVTVTGTGKGGRNQELVLAALLELQDVADKFLLLSCGTDGTDGPTDAAGAMITQGSWATAIEKDLNLLQYLQNNDAYHFFEAIDGLIKTGPTGTNVMDVMLVIVG